MSSVLGTAAVTLGVAGLLLPYTCTPLLTVLMLQLTPAKTQILIDTYFMLYVILCSMVQHTYSTVQYSVVYIVPV